MKNRFYASERRGAVWLTIRIIHITPKRFHLLPKDLDFTKDFKQNDHNDHNDHTAARRSLALNLYFFYP